MRWKHILSSRPSFAPFLARESKSLIASEREIRFAISAIMGVLVGIWGGRCGIISYHTTGVVRLFRFIHIVADIKKQARKACMAGGKGDTNTIRMLRS